MILRQEIAARSILLQSITPATAGDTVYIIRNLSGGILTTTGVIQKEQD